MLEGAVLCIQQERCFQAAPAGEARQFTKLLVAVVLLVLSLLQALMALAPESAVVVELDEDNRVVSEQTISSRLVHHGDLLKVCKCAWFKGQADVDSSQH